MIADLRRNQVLLVTLILHPLSLSRENVRVKCSAKMSAVVNGGVIMCHRGGRAAAAAAV